MIDASADVAAAGLLRRRLRAFGNRRSVGLSVGDTCCTVAFWLLLLYPTAKCLGWGTLSIEGSRTASPRTSPHCAAA
jgi:hypothetical protein